MNKTQNCAIISAEYNSAFIDDLRHILEFNNISVSIYSWNDLYDENIFNLNNIDIIVISKAYNYPAFLPEMLEKYIQKSGKVVFLGAEALSNEYYSINNKETSFRQIINKFIDDDYDKSILIPYSGNGVYCESLLSKEVTINSPQNVIGFWSKSYSETSCSNLNIYLTDKNGDCFIAKITLSSEFNYNLLSKKDFNAVNHAKEYINFNEIVNIQFECNDPFFIDELAFGHISILNDTKTIIDGVFPPTMYQSADNISYIINCSKYDQNNETKLYLPKEIYIAELNEYSGRIKPIITCYDKEDNFIGNVAYELINATNKNDSVPSFSDISVFCINDLSFYTNNGIEIVCDTILKMLSPVTLYQCSTYDNKINTSIIVNSALNFNDYKVKFQIGNLAATYSIDEMQIIAQNDTIQLRSVSFDINNYNDSFDVLLLKDDMVTDKITSI